MAESPQGREVVRAGLARWSGRVVRLDVIQVRGQGGLGGTERELLNRVDQLHPFPDPGWDLVGVDVDLVVQVDDLLHHCRPVTDELAELAGQHRPDTFDSEDSLTGGQGVVGEMHEQLGPTRSPARSPAGSAGAGAAVGLLLDSGKRRRQCAPGGRVHRGAVLFFDIRGRGVTVPWHLADPGGSIQRIRQVALAGTRRVSIRLVM